MTKLNWAYISSKSITALVSYGDDLIIKETPPVLSKFIGQSIKSLIKWMAKQGGLKVEKIVG